MLAAWQILADESLASGETLVRNLERGLATAARLGGAMPVGYLPDEFGHAAQMPQILRRAGLEHAVVWRGVPAAVGRHAFLWSAPDGSTVRAEYLAHGYGNAALLLEVPERLGERVARLDQRLQPYFGDGAPLLAMYGEDHSRPLPDLVELVAAANAAQDGYRIRLATLAGYIGEVGGRLEGLPAWRGELRSSARANLLMGVLSARVGLKAALGRAERQLERYAEPLQALHCRRWPGRFLELAWNKVIDSSGHDSITGCGADAVAQQVAARLAEAEQIGSGLRDRAAAEVALRVPKGAVAVLSPSPRAREGLVELDLEVPDDWGEVALELPDGRLLASQEVGRHVPVRYGFRPLPEPTRLETELPPRRRLLASVPVPPLGWTAARPRPARGEPPAVGPVTLDGSLLANGLVEVQVRPDGCLRVSGGGATLDGVARLVDGGDAGDSYTYAPPTTDLEVAEPEAVTVRAASAGPLRAAIKVLRTYRWPRGLDGAGGAARSAELAEVAVTTTVELRAGEASVRLRVSFDNPCEQHRVRLHVPLATAASASAAEGQFAVVLDHVSEYELVGGGGELAITLLRSVGLISRNTNPYRVEPAGPETRIPGAQRIGPVEATMAVLPYQGTWAAAGVAAQAERYRHDLVAADGRGPEGPLEAVAGLQIAGDGGTVLSSLRRRRGWLELRVVREHPDPGTATISGRFTRARACDLLGRAGPALPAAGGTLHLDLHPWEIRTVQLR